MKRHILILEGPDNIGKSTVIKQLKEHYEGQGLKVQVLCCPDRSDFNNSGLVNYYMGNSSASPLERQFFILNSSIAQYGEIKPDTHIVLFDRHPIVSNRVYFHPEDCMSWPNNDSTAAMAYRTLVDTMTVKMAEVYDISSTTCVILTGNHPHVDPDAGEFFETKWLEKKVAYDQVKYCKFLADCNILCCSVDVHKHADCLLPLIGEAFRTGREHIWGEPFQPIALHTDTGEGEHPSTEVYTVQQGLL